jgi:hypothetical protein
MLQSRPNAALTRFKRKTDENSSVLRSFLSQPKLSRRTRPRRHRLESVASPASDGQASAALGAAGVDDGAAALGFHARAEAVGALATYDGGLVGAFHVISKVRKSPLLDSISP